MQRRTPRSTLFPYTTLFRSTCGREDDAADSVENTFRDQQDEIAKDNDKNYRDKGRDRKSTRLNSSHTVISYAVFCLKKKKMRKIINSFSTNETTCEDIWSDI